jgi:release factor glutamine methyltransferase
MGIKIQTIRDIRNYLAMELKEIYPVSEISAIASIIIKTLFGISRLHQLSENDQYIPPEMVKRIKGICTDLKSGKPIQYILGETIFYDCIIMVNNDTLIPRPETEELVDLIIRENSGFTGNIIDVGTGSGCIAVALAANIPGASITAIDISDNAIKVAAQNADLNNVNISFLTADINNFKPSSQAGIIVSNPPYVRNSERQYMSKNVLDFEPQIALFVPDSDPLIFYRAILKMANVSLIPHGKVYFEINEAMGESMFRLLESFNYSGVKVFCDINGKERIIKGTGNG